MVRESNLNEFLIQIDASSFAEFEIFEFEVSRIDCIMLNVCSITVYEHAMDVMEYVYQRVYMYIHIK